MKIVDQTGVLKRISIIPPSARFTVFSTESPQYFRRLITIFLCSKRRRTCVPFNLLLSRANAFAYNSSIAEIGRQAEFRFDAAPRMQSLIRCEACSRESSSCAERLRCVRWQPGFKDQRVLESHYLVLSLHDGWLYESRQKSRSKSDDFIFGRESNSPEML